MTVTGLRGAVVLMTHSQTGAQVHERLAIHIATGNTFTLLSPSSPRPVFQPLVGQTSQSSLAPPTASAAIAATIRDPFAVQAFNPNLLAEAAARSASSDPIVSREVSLVAQDFYGFDTAVSVGSNGFAPQTLPAALPALMPASQLAVRLGSSLGTRFTAWLVGVAGGTRLAWGSLPGWLRSAMALIGLSGSTILVDQATEGPIQIPGFTGGGSQLDIQVGRFYDGRIITNTWLANGIQFWATGSGRDLMHHVLKMDGSIKSWKPQRPIVLMPGGAKNIRDLLRADDIVDRQLKKVGKALRRRTPRKAPAPKQPTHVIVDSPHHIVS